MDPNKEKALKAALDQIERQFGKGTVMRMGDKRAGGDAVHLDRFVGVGYCFGHWWLAKRSSCRNLRARIFR